MSASAGPPVGPELRLVSGAAAQFTFDLTIDGEAVNLGAVGTVVWMNVGYVRSSCSAVAIVLLDKRTSTAGETSVVGASADGRIQFNFFSTDTLDALPAVPPLTCGAYKYDIWGTVNGKNYAFLSPSPFVVYPGVGP